MNELFGAAIRLELYLVILTPEGKSVIRVLPEIYRRSFDGLSVGRNDKICFVDMFSLHIRHQNLYPGIEVRQKTIVIDVHDDIERVVARCNPYPDGAAILPTRC